LDARGDFGRGTLGAVRKLLSRKLLLIGVVALLVAGGGGALAATQLASNPRQAYLNDVAKRLGVTPAKLSAAMQGATIDQIEAAVKAGKLTRAQADKMEQAIKTGGKLPFPAARLGRPLRFFGPAGPGWGFAMRAGPFELGAAALKYLGISAASLRSGIAAGKTLGQIADATPGKSAAGLQSAVLAARRAQLAKAVADKQLTAAQETMLLARLQKTIHALINAHFAAGQGGPMPKFRAPGRHGMFPGLVPYGGPPIPVHPSYAPPPPGPGGII
jgi:hypothetical protein